MALDYPALQAELLAGHPDTGPYNADDALAANELNAYNRAVATPAEEFLEYCLEQLHRTNVGKDTSNTNIYGRIEMVAEATEGADVFAQGGATPPEVTVGQIAAAKALIAYMSSSISVLSDAADVDSAVTKMQGADALSSADGDALKALGDNRTNRTQEINFGRTLVNASHVNYARGL